MRFILLLLALCIGSALATSVVPKPLEELVRESDVVVVATVTRVDMVDGHGRQVLDRSARTGPGLRNTIRLHLQLGEVLSGGSASLGPTMTVPLWTAWHYELGRMQEQLTGAIGIFLLKRDGSPVYPAYFQRSLPERDEIQRILQAEPRPKRST